MTDTVPMDRLQAVAALAPTETNGHKPAASTSSASANGKDYAHRLIVDKWLQARGVTFNAKSDGDRTIYIFDCPFDESHKGDANITQQANGALSAGCFHDSDSGKKWPDFREAIGAPDPDHWDPPRRESSRERTSPTIALTADDLRAQIERMASESPVFAPPAASSIQPAADRPRLAPGTLVRARDRNNFGTVIADDGSLVKVHFVSPDGSEKDVDFAPGELRLADGQPVDPAEIAKVEIITAAKLIADHPTQRPVLIDGLLRKGEVMNIIAKSKTGKSWLTYHLALSIACGLRLFGRCGCTRGRVLLIDNELHPEVLAHRIPMVAEAMGIQPAEYADRIQVMSLRGRLMPIADLGPSLEEIEYGYFSLIVLDALYRMLPGGMSENDNAAMAAVYNHADRYAAMTGAALGLVHHPSKGAQGEKDVIDVGAGAGSQSRAADTHLVLRPHEQDGCAVLEAAVRSFAPVEPTVLQWDFPLWTAADGLDPAALKRAPTRQDDAQEQRDRAGCGAIVDALRRQGPSTARGLRAANVSRERLERLLAVMEADGRLVSREKSVRGNTCTEYDLASHLRDVGGTWAMAPPT